ncbi:MAG: hypothetical protein HUU41_11830 [Bryobacteraceae bacterium]|nr:hypothetical protein [Bryobacterales bacterium]MEB2363763.1 hypothetical protein [Bryobacterales bacterium]NUN01796.1 hypothetical protein [Bryobacteraceae bacterium]
MYSLDNVFNELIDKIRDPDALNPAKSDPVFYLAYRPELMLQVKRHLPRWISKIREAGFDVATSLSPTSSGTASTSG